MEDEIEARFICPICCEVLKKPIVMICKHRFCENCIIECHKHNPLCPVCRIPIDPKQFVEDKRLERDIFTATVTCQPCGQKFSLIHFNAHVITCSKRQRAPQTTTHIPSSKHIVPNRATFKCPLCHRSNLDCASLIDHCNRRHKDSKEHVVCPVCASMPWGNSDQISSHFISHLNMRHKFEYDTYVDYEQDDDEALKAAIEASLFQN